ncbi:MAG: hypothetical protein ACYDA6_05910 [Solirubrobacteraceae bacterium]
MSIELLELAAQALEPVLADVVFLGGATIELWITDPGAPPPLPTKDVDVVLVETTTRSAFYSFEERLRSLRFEEDREAGIICRFRHLDSDLVLDAMPAEASILGFENRWQGASIPHAIERELPSGARIRAASPPYLLATKVEAFKSRGGGDFLMSRDLTDIIVLVDGREELVAEVHQAPPELRAYLTEELTGLMEEPRFLDGVFAALRGDAASQARAEVIVMPRLRAMCAEPSAD